MNCNYHISWLEMALERFKNNNKIIHTVNGNLTIKEFLEQNIQDELDKIIKIDQ